jgi:hypothetical protein
MPQPELAPLRGQPEPGQPLDGPVVQLGGHAAALALGHRQDLVDQPAAVLLSPGLDGPLPGPGPLDPPEQDQGQERGRGHHGQRPGLGAALGGAGRPARVGRGGAQRGGQPFEARGDLGAVDPVGGHQVARGQQLELGVEGGLPVDGGGPDPGHGRVAGEQGGQLGQGGGELLADGGGAPGRGVVRGPARGGPRVERRLLVRARLEQERQPLGPLKPRDLAPDPGGAGEGGHRDDHQRGGKRPRGGPLARPRRLVPARVTPPPSASGAPS